MNKITLICFCFIIALVANAQTTIGSYHSKYFDKEFDISASKKDKDNSYSIYIGVDSKGTNKYTYLNFNSSDFYEIKTSLIKIKNKFSEWSKVAYDNNITEMTKRMDFIIPKTTICWHDNKWHFAFDQNLQPMFIILDDGRHVLSFLEKVTSSSNKYIEETIYWIFTDPQEIGEIITWLDKDKIEELVTKENRVEDLFQ